MIHYIESYTENGSPIRIEVEDTSKPAAGFTRHTSPSDLSSDAVKDAYDQTLNVIKSCANGIIDTIQNLSAPPSAAAVEFSVKIDAEVGAMIAKARDEGQFKVSLSWKQSEPDKDD